ncbi:GNAT family N-acetyltransferase [Gallaecimonas xiamenensis]|uniref:Acetyltransferase n=1 Tax=Gallaecimonas xiamenensis 3-C-1 TaxID=745411 RepID=K2IYY3_9GAMM|nr:GNAT family N-acetyltransferase [Gallaecimonas xiamenensis]EKE68108.1 acetyltransferase [Gallaecimonas xiamenensis 3-C-1]
MNPVAQSPRLWLQLLGEKDAPFVLELVNQPAWIANIGDKGVRTLDGAKRYLAEGPLASYRQHGFGLYLVSLKDGTPIGLCGLLKRDYLDHPDIGYALHSGHWGQGYAREAARAVLDLARQKGLGTLLAITLPQNQPSCALLETLGFSLDGLTQVPGGSEALRLYRLAL